jgi:hypothetical protein
MIEPVGTPVVLSPATLFVVGMLMPSLSVLRAMPEVLVMRYPAKTNYCFGISIFGEKS